MAAAAGGTTAAARSPPRSPRGTATRARVPATPPRRGDPLPATPGGLVDLASIADARGRVTIAGFGSLLSRRSAALTFPDLENFRVGRLAGGGPWRRVFAHTTAVFHARGVARPATREVASLSVERAPPGGRERPAPLVVSLFEVVADGAAAAALVDREHEFRLIAVPAVDEAGATRTAVVCAAWTDDEYRAARCPPDEWARRYTGVYPDGSPFSIAAVWDDPAVLPCRAYLRHCVLAARSLGPAAEACLLTNTWLADRTTRLDAWLAANPDIMEEEPPAALRDRYSG